MSDERKQPRRSSRPTKKPADVASAAPTVESRSTETPALAIEQASELRAPPSDAIESEIRRQAYELYLSRGGGDGNDLSDWLEAERIIRGRRTPSPDASSDIRG